MTKESKAGVKYTGNNQELESVELKAHYNRVYEYFQDPLGTKNYLGFTSDPNFMYRWVTTNDPNRRDRVERLSKLGWIPVMNEVTNEDTQAGKPGRMGSGAVIKEHGNGSQQMLMKIPRELYELNQSIKKQIASQKALFDENGDPVPLNTTRKQRVVSGGATTKILQEEIGSDITM